MGLWQIDADTLASSRFVVSPLAETLAALIALTAGSAAHEGQRRWLDEHRPAYRALLAADPVLAALVPAALGKGWIADFLTPTPGPVPDIAAELAGVRATPPGETVADLEVALRHPVPDLLRRDDLGPRAADLLAWVWTTTVLPDWPRRRRVLEADILARTSRLGTDGWAAALDAMRPHMRWLGDGRLQINAQDHPPRRVVGAQLMFVPVTPHHGWVTADTDDRYGIVYPCAGVLTEVGGHLVPESLSRLLGSGRSQLLMLLDDPKTTTQLVALSGQRLGSVGGHLKVLLDAGLVQRRRAGRSVLYYWTDAGRGLVRAQPG